MLSHDILQKIKSKLQQQKGDSLSRIAELEATDPFNLDSAAHLVDDRTSPDDEAQVNEVHERVSAQVGALKNSIIRIDSAVERIDAGTYGVCEACGKEIEESRLTIMPLASLCMADEKSIESKVKKATS